MTPSSSLPTAPETQEAPSPFAALHGVPEGAQGLVLAEKLAEGAGLHLHLCLDDREMERLRRAAAFFMPDVEVMALPAWDCLPYDRVSPHRNIMAERLATLTRLLDTSSAKPALLLTTTAGMLQKLPPREAMRRAAFGVTTGQQLDLPALQEFFLHYGYQRVGKVMEPGEVALRGGIIDIFPSGHDSAYRIDLFGEEVESIREVDPLTQRSGESLASLALHPASEVVLSEASITRFRSLYRELFGAAKRDDALYAAISAGQHYPGMEHWLPLFYERMETVLDYAPAASVTCSYRCAQALEDRALLTRDYYGARQAQPSRSKSSRVEENLYHPLPPEMLYLSAGEAIEALQAKEAAEFSPFSASDEGGYGMKPVAALAASKGEKTTPVERLLAQVTSFRAQGKRTVIACQSSGSRERIRKILTEALAAHPFSEFEACGSPLIRRFAPPSPQGEKEKTSLQSRSERIPSPPGERARVRGEDRDICLIDCWGDVTAELPPLPLGEGSISTLYLAILPLEQGFSTPDAILYSEQDIFGARLMRARPKREASEAFLQEAAGFELGELLVHQEHGIGRFDGLVAMEAGGAKHDCLKLVYRDEARLFLPVENMELITRFGSEESGGELDRLGAAQWQERKARMKERIKLAAAELMKTAAARALHRGAVLHPPTGLYETFCAGFPYQETEDQARSIEEVLGDLAAGKPMDRLVCGDVGFGKTEIALRAAFVAAADADTPVQVALVTPTTLLARQHYKDFSARFAGTGVRVAMLSRLTSSKDARLTREGLKDGSIQIVVGTHALLSKSTEFHQLGLLVIDEEQHFGVKQKERLKALKANVHVLTLSATPIPRTLQMALSGVKQLSLIATPPVDRLAIRTFIRPFDPVILAEAIARERHRGGQIFYVTPRIADIPALKERIRELAPDAKLAVAHGQMKPADLDGVMNAFYDGEYDILLSTAIIESGLDIPTANTIIINRADRFGLAQLYQLRGRIGRGRVRAYAYLTLPPASFSLPLRGRAGVGADVSPSPNLPPSGGGITETALKRLEVMQSLDTLGAGFSLASHDMDIRGFGNLVGEEQSGHIREVGAELYQQMLTQAVEQYKTQEGLAESEKETGTKSDWSPQINLGIPVMLPEHYVEDLSLRLSLYRRLSRLETEEEVADFAAELEDRFGLLPGETKHLLAIVRLKGQCRSAGVARIDTGPKGAVLTFREEALRDPEALIGYVTRHANSMKLKPDGKLVVLQRYASDVDRLRQVSQLIGTVGEL